MEKGPLADLIVATYDDLSAQLQAAARFVLEHPHDVALLSMREQARQAGLQPATMTRLAQHIGLQGYDAVRALYADALREVGPDATGGASAPASRPALKGDRALAANMLSATARHLQRLASADGLDGIAAAAKALAKARRIHVLGQRACFGAAWHLHQSLRLIGRKAHLLDAPGGTGPDALASADRDDVLVVIGIEPHVPLVLDVAALAVERGVTLVALTDSPVSPLGRLARHSILVSTTGPSPLPAMSPAFAVVEILVAIVAQRGGDRALASIARNEAHLASLAATQAPRPGRLSREDAARATDLQKGGHRTRATKPDDR
jgi:DNA-binding MurR/RpiR family transcriptional regulator